MKKVGTQNGIGAPMTGPFNGAGLIRFDPDAMKKPSPLITEGQEVSLFSERGEGLAAVYDTIRDRNDENFREISRQVLEMFENIERLQLKATTNSHKVLQIKLKSGEEIPADQMSEGLLYFLGFAALPYLAPTSVLLVEEPENGLHPARIKEVMQVLRKVSEKTQVLLATHSPLVINEMRPEEVSVVTRTPEEGTKVVCIKDTPNFAERFKIYSLGELWLSYADGDREAPLMDPEEP